MKKPASFVEWIVAKYWNTNTAQNDLATDIMLDLQNFPAKSAKGVIKNYLLKNGACAACVETFENAWKEYSEYKKLFRVNNV